MRTTPEKEGRIPPRRVSGPRRARSIPAILSRLLPEKRTWKWRRSMARFLRLTFLLAAGLAAPAIVARPAAAQSFFTADIAGAGAYFTDATASTNVTVNRAPMPGWKVEGAVRVTPRVAFVLAADGAKGRSNDLFG